MHSSHPQTYSRLISFKLCRGNFYGSHFDRHKPNGETKPRYIAPLGLHSGNLYKSYLHLTCCIDFKIGRFIGYISCCFQAGPFCCYFAGISLGFVNIHFKWALCNVLTSKQNYNLEIIVIVLKIGMHDQIQLRSDACHLAFSSLPNYESTNWSLTIIHTQSFWRQESL